MARTPIPTTPEPAPLMIAFTGAVVQPDPLRAPIAVRAGDKVRADHELVLLRPDLFLPADSTTAEVTAAARLFRQKKLASGRSAQEMSRQGEAANRGRWRRMGRPQRGTFSLLGTQPAERPEE